MKRVPLVVASVLTVLLALPAGPSAQMEWLDKGRRLLGGPDGAPAGVTPALPGGTGLGVAEVASGLREALKVGTERVVTTLGARDGYAGDPAVRIPLPDSLKTAQSVLKKVGASGMADDLELRLNRAAEAAAPEAKAVFFDAISQMTLADAERIYRGPDDAATRYFQATMSEPLKQRMRPIVDRSLADAGAVQAYDGMMGRYKSVPFVPDVKADLTDHALQGALDGLFHYLAVEEAAIRQNPAKRTTDLLQKVFGRTS